MFIPLTQCLSLTEYQRLYVQNFYKNFCALWVFFNHKLRESTNN